MERKNKFTMCSFRTRVPTRKLPEIKMGIFVTTKSDLSHGLINQRIRARAMRFNPKTIKKMTRYMMNSRCHGKSRNLSGFHGVTACVSLICSSAAVSGIAVSGISSSSVSDDFPIDVIPTEFCSIAVGKEYSVIIAGVTVINVPYSTLSEW